MGHTGKIACLFALLLSSGRAGASAWTNLAPDATMYYNDAGISGHVTQLQDREVVRGRYHQSIDFDVTPGKISFVLADATDISLVRFWNWTDPTGGEMTFHLEQLTGTDPTNDAHWTLIPGTEQTFASYPRGYSLSFPTVNTKGLRWVLTHDNNPSGVGNIRYSEFEYYAADVNALDLTALADCTITHSGGANMKPTVADDDISTRFEGSTGPQQVTVLWNDPHALAHMRIFVEDAGIGDMADFALLYLTAGGDPGNPGDWLATGYDFSSNDKNILDLMLDLTTRGLRLDIRDPSTNTGHPILRLWELEVFEAEPEQEAAIPEPVTALLVAFGAIGLARRRRAA